MQYKNILVTGGAGFVGSHICIKLKKYYPNCDVIALDNLMRRGSELNLPRLKQHDVHFIHGDVRNKADLENKQFDLLVECSAEPSVMAGVNSSPEYLLETNLIGAINCFEAARKNMADIIFLSTSRVYPIKKINELLYEETKTRFVLSENQTLPGATHKGISEEFPLDGVRSMYGATKLSAELLLQEYIENYKIKGVINRFGLITGPWQMGKVDQGIIALWMAKHIFKKPLSYMGFKGKGKQVRDIIHVDDVFEIISLQIEDMKKFSGNLYNIGGGLGNSVSLLELTDFCQQMTKNKVTIKHVFPTRPGDIRVYITDNSKIQKITSWKPKKNTQQTLLEIQKWIVDNKRQLEHIFS